MRKISSSITFEIEPGETASMLIGDSTRLTAEGAPLWVTRSNDVEDYWLQPGAALHLRRGERLWLSVEGSAKAEARFVAPLTSRALVGDWLGTLTERLAARWRGGWHTV